MPTCDKCKEDFQLWYFGSKALISLIILGIGLLAVGIIFFIVQLPFELWGNLSILGLVVMTTSIILLKILKGAKSNPYRYMKFDKKTGNFYIKPGVSQEWLFFSDWADSIMIIRAQEGLACPKCHNSEITSTICDKCGTIITA